MTAVPAKSMMRSRAMSFLLAQPGVRKEDAAMTGYSFGAMVALSAGYERAEIARIVAVALPLAMAEARVPDGASKPVLLVSGDRDSYSPVAGLQALVSKIGGSARLEIIAGADHFFNGRESELSRVIAAAIAWLTSLGNRRRCAGRLPDGIEGILGMRLRDRNDLRDRRAQIAVIHPIERREIVQLVKIDQVVHQHRVVQRLLVEIEALESR